MTTRHIVPHTHWDREWYRTFQQFRIRLVRLIDRLLDILAKDKNYSHFMLDGQTSLLEDYLEIRPERKEEIARLVREGRLAIGPWHVLPDEFLVAPESLLRNLLLGKQTSQQFGAEMPVGYVPDLFGHIAQLPQILQGFGIENAVLRRGLAEEPVELWWDAPDGSRVLICYLRNGYDNATRLPMSNPEAFIAAIKTATDRLTPYVGSGQILLMAGNDHQEPDPRLSDLIAYANNELRGKDSLLHSSLPAYVASVYEAVKDQELLTVTGELRSPQRHHLLPGVLSTRMWIKQRNDAIETLLLRWTEPFSAWAELLVARDSSVSDSHTHLSGHESLAYVRQNAGIIWQAWRILLDNHPHDSICGCSVDQVHREMAVRFDQSEQIAEEIAALSLTMIADSVDTRGCVPSDGFVSSVQPLIVFNPGSVRTDVITTQLCLPEASEGIEIVGPDGRILPYAVSTEPISEEERLFFYRELSADELGPYFSMVRGGRLLNNVIHQIRVIARGHEVEVLLSIGKRGIPNRAQVALAQAKIEDLLARGQVSLFIVRTLMTELSDLTFIAPDLPAYGYATFMLRSARASTCMNQESDNESDTLAIENDLFLVQVSSRDGSLTLTDKTTDTVYSGLNRFEDGGDRGDTYTYCQPEQDELISEPVEPPVVRFLEKNAVRQVLEISQVYQLPLGLAQDRASRAKITTNVSIVSQVSMYLGVPRIDIKTTINNQVEDHRLRVHFPVPVASEFAHTETHFHVAQRAVPQVQPDQDSSGWIEQPASTVPQRGWADVSDGQIGLMVANRGLPEVEFIPGDKRTSIALTLLRCVGWLSRDDIHCRRGRAGSLLPTPEAQCLGYHSFNYSIIPHKGQWQNARAQAEAFRSPLRAIATEIQQGQLAPSASLVDADSSSFLISSIKQPQDSSKSGLIVRGVNLSDKPSTVHLKPWKPFDRASRIQLNEVEQETLSIAEDGSVTILMRSWEIVTIKWEDTMTEIRSIKSNRSGPD